MPGAFTNKLQPRKFFRNEKCTAACSCNPVKAPGEIAELIHGWFEAGNNNDTIIALAAKVNYKLSNGAVGRHRKNHLTPHDQADPNMGDGRLAKVNHIEMLEQIVSRGAQNIPVARISPDLALKAIDMIYKLSAGNQMSDLMTAVTAAMASDDGDEGEYMTPVEAVDAKLAADEAAQAETVGG